MKAPMLSVTYTTKEKILITKDSYKHARKELTAKPLKIVRRPCGQGAASNRYYYEGCFEAPEDALSVTQGTIWANIVRKENPCFDPKVYKFIENVCRFE